VLGECRASIHVESPAPEQSYPADTSVPL
jgi:hypothetical protein